VARRLQALGVSVLTSALARSLAEDGAGLLVETEDGGERSVAADLVLVAVGRRPRLDGFGLEGLDLDRDGAFLRIDERCATAMRNVWAVGDITGEPMLAHRAMAQGEVVAEIVAGKRRVFDKAAIPAVCFTDPEIVTAGLSPEAARAAGHAVRVGQFPFAANGRAMTLGADEGFVRIVARADNHLVLGIQAVGQGVAELAAGFGLALEMGARLEDVAATVHAHPTLGEAIPEAAFGALGLALHV
jgi:dihydrolipoamide dehydrogenase